MSVSRLKHCVIRIAQWPVQWFIWIFLRPRRGTVGNLSRSEVMAVYRREAATYDAKHHFTTRGQDTLWRQEAGWCVRTMALRLSRPPRVIDLCTGTGLTPIEIVRVLNHSQLTASIVGIDLSQDMLRVARERNLSTVSFVRGDANTTLVVPSSVDVITQIFGLGGIPRPHQVFENTLQALREGGEYYLVDMHAPIAALPGEVPFLAWWLRLPALESVTWLHTTLPLALARLWGWRDTTEDFAKAPRTTTEQQGARYGFETLRFDVRSERWWFGLPVMPVAHLHLRKVRIS